MNEIKTGSTTFDEEIAILYDMAAEELPAAVTAEEEIEAWIAKRVIEISEMQRKQKQTIQVLLATWINDYEKGSPIWANHPNHYGSLREFLNDVGTESEGNKLTPSVITEIVTISDTIVPYCRANKIEINGFIVGKLWTKFREVVSYIKMLVEDDDPSAINAVLSDVKALPTRDALREKYRNNRDAKPAKSEALTKNGTSIVVTVVPTESLADIKRALGRYTEWDTIAVGKFGDRVVNITVKP